MKQVLTLLFFIFTCSAFGQAIEEKLKAVLDSVILKSKEISLYSNTVNWESLEKEIYSKAAHAKNIDDLKPAFEMLLNGLKDHHGRIMKISDYSILAHFTDWQNARFSDNRERASEIWSIVNDIESRFQYALLPNNIAYLKIVGVGPNVDGQKEAERIRNALTELCKKKVDKWIIDLRYNGGGNANVMLSGLAPLLDSGTVATVQNFNKEIIGAAEIKKGDYWYFNFCSFPIGKKPKIKNPKIAILTSRWTVSSGELVAVAFKGQDDTKFFGEATGGYTTNTGWDVINNKVAVVIGSGIFCDRNGNIYEHNVKPDIEILFEIEKNKDKDKAIMEAKKWLIEK